MLLVSIWDIKDLKAKNQKKDIVVYITFMALTGALGVFFFANPERDSFSKILLSLVGQEGD